jgi:hypothetical protein
MDYYIEELEMPFGPRVAWEALARLWSFGEGAVNVGYC